MGLGAAKFDFPDTESFLPWLLPSPVTKERIKVLASALTIGKTYFFRDQPESKALEEEVLPSDFNPDFPAKTREEV
jgi:chemotaxis methyl-accepting protein methylase